MNESIDNSELFIHGYCLWRLDKRDKKGGGVAFYVKRNIDCEIISKYEQEHIKAGSKSSSAKTPRWLCL